MTEAFRSDLRLIVTAYACACVLLVAGTWIVGMFLTTQELPDYLQKMSKTVIGASMATAVGGAIVGLPGLAAYTLLSRIGSAEHTGIFVRQCFIGLLTLGVNGVAFGDFIKPLQTDQDMVPLSFAFVGVAMGLIHAKLRLDSAKAPKVAESDKGDFDA